MHMRYILLFLLSSASFAFAGDTQELSDDFDQASVAEELEGHIEQNPGELRMDYLNRIRPHLPTSREWLTGSYNGSNFSFERNGKKLVFSRKDVTDAYKPNTLQGLASQVILNHKLDYSLLPNLIGYPLVTQKNVQISSDPFQPNISDDGAEIVSDDEPSPF